MLHALDRQKIILDNLKFDSVTSISHLIQKTKFHESTIRRDLKILAINQKIVIVRGGVMPLKEIDKKPNIIQNLEQKKKIAKYAASLIKEKDSIIINGGTTCSLIPDYLKNNNKLASDWDQIWEDVRETKTEEFYSSKKLTIYAVANILNLPKETVRRKIERLKKKRLINHSSKTGLLPTSKSEEVMKPFAEKEIKSLSKFLQSLKKNKSLDEILNFKD